MEAVGLPGIAAKFTTDTGIPMKWVIVLNEDNAGKPPTAATAKAYATTVKAQGYPVTADPSGQLYKMTPWDGLARPGKCALAPDMTILKCTLGKDNTALLKAIQAHAAANGGK